MKPFTLAGPAGSIAWNTGVPDASGCYWIARDLDGWDGSDVGLNLQPRLRSRGQLVTGGDVLGRSLSVQGAWLLAPSEPVRVSSKDRLQAVLLSIGNDDVSGLVTVNDPTAVVGVTLDRFCAVASNQRPTCVDQPPAPGSLGAAPLGIVWPCIVFWSVLAPDPLRYASTLSTVALASGVAAAAPNAGTAPASPVITLTAPGSPVTLFHAESGRTVTLAGSMPATLVIDLAARTVVDGGGVDRYDLVTSSPGGWWELRPGANTVTVTGSAGSLSWRSAWW